MTSRDNVTDTNSRLKVTLLTGRTIEQGVGKESGKSSEEYFQSVAVCYIDAEDLKKLGIKAGTNVRVSTTCGSIIVRALKSLRGPHRGVVFVPYGAWANAVMCPDTGSTGMPSFKGIPAEIEPASEEAVLELAELLKQQFGK